MKHIITILGLLLLAGCSAAQPEYRAASVTPVFSIDRRAVIYGDEAYKTNGVLADGECQLEHPESTFATYQFDARNRSGCAVLLQGWAAGDIIVMTTDYTTGRWYQLPYQLTAGVLYVLFRPEARNISPTGRFYMSVIVDNGGRATINRTDMHFTESYDLLNDTLMAIPLTEDAAVGEPVRFVILTGIMPNPFTNMNAVTLTCDIDMLYTPDSFNVGEIGGSKWFPDGIWRQIEKPVIEFADWMIYPREDNGQRYYVFNVTPVHGQEIEGAWGCLFNVEMQFSEPGEKHVRFLEVGEGLLINYYTGADPDTRYLWSDIQNPVGHVTVR